MEFEFSLKILEKKKRVKKTDDKRIEDRTTYGPIEDNVKECVCVFFSSENLIMWYFFVSFFFFIKHYNLIEWLKYFCCLKYFSCEWHFLLFSNFSPIRTNYNLNNTIVNNRRDLFLLRTIYRSIFTIEHFWRYGNRFGCGLTTHYFPSAQTTKDTTTTTQI